MKPRNLFFNQWSSVVISSFSGFLGPTHLSTGVVGGWSGDFEPLRRLRTTEDTEVWMKPKESFLQSVVSVVISSFSGFLGPTHLSARAVGVGAG